jgi:predicted oxidoreductase
MNFTPENGSTLQVVVVGENRIGTVRLINPCAKNIVDTPISAGFTLLDASDVQGHKEVRRG